MAEVIYIGDIIYKELQSQGRSVAWLARQLGTSRMACYRLFHSYSIDTQVLFRISGLLGRDFFAVYSEKLADKGQMQHNCYTSETSLFQRKELKK
jgi:hypothetical protein